MNAVMLYELQWHIVKNLSYKPIQPFCRWIIHPSHIPTYLEELGISIHVHTELLTCVDACVSAWYILYPAKRVIREEQTTAGFRMIHIPY